MHLSRITVLVVAASLTACASTPTLPLARPSAQQQAEVVVYRESSFIAGGVSLTVGVNGRAVANIGNSDKIRALLPAGEHEFFVQARSATPTKVKVQLEPGASVCLRTSSSASTLAKVAVPITLIASGYYFYLNQISCPPKTDLDKYKEVPVAYQ